jgi:methyl-accepting chemotaxis protein
MNRLQKIGPRLMIPIVLATIVFSILLYVVAGNVIGKMMTYNLERLGRSKMADIASSEKRISGAQKASGIFLVKRQRFEGQP